MCAPVSFSRWSSSHSTSRATKWCTGLHQRGSRGANGVYLRCGPLERTAPLWHSFGRVSHMNSKSAPSSMSSREQTVMSKLARHWRKVGGCEWLDASVLWGLHVWIHVFKCTILHAQRACVRLYNSCPQLAVRAGWGLDYIMFKSGVVKHAWVLKPIHKHPSACVILIFHREWLWQSLEVWLKPNCKF